MLSERGQTLHGLTSVMCLNRKQWIHGHEDRGGAGVTGLGFFSEVVQML